MAALAAVLVREKQAGLEIRLAQIHRKATTVGMALRMLRPMQLAVAAVLVQQATMQQIPTVGTVEMVRLHPFLAHLQRMRVAAVAQHYREQRDRAALAAAVLAGLATELGRELMEQSTLEAEVAAVTTLTAVPAAPASSSSSTPYPSNLS